jgi:hypothetical protein
MLEFTHLVAPKTLNIVCMYVYGCTTTIEKKGYSASRDG